MFSVDVEGWCCEIIKIESHHIFFAFKVNGYFVLVILGVVIFFFKKLWEHCYLSPLGYSNIIAYLLLFVNRLLKVFTYCLNCPTVISGLIGLMFGWFPVYHKGIESPFVFVMLIVYRVVCGLSILFSCVCNYFDTSFISMPHTVNSSVVYIV